MRLNYGMCKRICFFCLHIIWFFNLSSRIQRRIPPNWKNICNPILKINGRLRKYVGGGGRVEWEKAAHNCASFSVTREGQYKKLTAKIPSYVCGGWGLFYATPPRPSDLKTQERFKVNYLDVGEYNGAKERCWLPPRGTCAAFVLRARAAP